MENELVERLANLERENSKLRERVIRLVAELEKVGIEPETPEPDPAEGKPDLARYDHHAARRDPYEPKVLHQGERQP